jgi:hypothetical protein
VRLSLLSCPHFSGKSDERFVCVVDDGGVSLLCVPCVLGLVTSVIMSAGRSVSISSSSYVFPRVVTIFFFNFFFVVFLRLVRGGVLSFKKAGGPTLGAKLLPPRFFLEGGGNNVLNTNFGV